MLLALLLLRALSLALRAGCAGLQRRGLPSLAGMLGLVAGLLAMCLPHPGSWQGLQLPWHHVLAYCLLPPPPVVTLFPCPQVVLEVLERNVRQGSAVYESGHVVVLAWCTSEQGLSQLQRVLSQVRACVLMCLQCSIASSACGLC